MVKQPTQVSFIAPFRWAVRLKNGQEIELSYNEIQDIFWGSRRAWHVFSVLDALAKLRYCEELPKEQMDMLVEKIIQMEMEGCYGPEHRITEIVQKEIMELTAKKSNDTT